MSTLKVSTISPLGTDATNTITIGSAGDVVAGAGANTPAFHVNNKFSSDLPGSGDQNISDSTFTKVINLVKLFDTDNAYSTSDSRFTVPTGEAGKYFFCANIAPNSTSDFDGFINAIYVNGSIKASCRTRSEFYDNLFTTLVVDLSVGDYVENYVEQKSGGTIAIRGDFEDRFFQGFKLIGA